MSPTGPIPTPEPEDFFVGPSDADPIGRTDSAPDQDEPTEQLKTRQYVLENVAEAASGLLNFVRQKYGKPGEPFEFTCPHHQRLASHLDALKDADDITIHPVCEGCNEPADYSDVDGIHLCSHCFVSLLGDTLSQITDDNVRLAKALEFYAQEWDIKTGGPDSPPDRVPTENLFQDGGHLALKTLQSIETDIPDAS